MLVNELELPPERKIGGLDRRDSMTMREDRREGILATLIHFPSLAFLVETLLF